MRMEFIQSQSNVSDPLTCRNNRAHKYRGYTTRSWSAHSTASIYAAKKTIEQTSA